jgi:hypothetical protein
MAETRFPGDPRYERWISPSQEELEALSENDFLSTNLLDCILQRTAPPPEEAAQKRQSGRRRTKQLCMRSKFVELEESPITCSIFGKRGHNQRTCPN